MYSGLQSAITISPLKKFIKNIRRQFVHPYIIKSLWTCEKTEV